MKHGVHLVGSVPMNNASEVFETVAADVGPALRYQGDIASIPKLPRIRAEVAGLR